MIRPSVRSHDSTGVWVSCRRCEADDPTHVFSGGDRLLGIPGEFRVVRCRRCGFLYTNPQPDEPTLALHYPPGYHAPPRSSTGSGRLRSWLRAGVLAARGYPIAGTGVLRRALGLLACRLLRRRFLWLPPFVPGGTLVDVGCGTGAYLAEMRELGWTVIGVEPNADAALVARNELGLDVRTGTFEEAGLPEGCADVVVMRMALEHVRDPRRTLAGVRRVLKPEGRLLLSVPNAASLERRLFGTHWFAWELPRHLSHFTPPSFKGLLIDAGLTPVRIHHLVNANSIAASLRYLVALTGAAAQWQTRPLLPLAVLASLLRRSGRMAAEAFVLTRTIRCAVCGPGASGRVVMHGRDRLAGLPGSCEVVRCNACRLLVTWPQPRSIDDVAALYPTSYPPYRGGADTGRPARFSGHAREQVRTALLSRRGYPSPKPPSMMARAVARALKLPANTRLRRFPPFVPGGIVLDVGCGAGYDLAELRDHGWRCVGLELDQATAERARRELGLDVRAGTLEDASLPEASFDVVILRHVLEHLADPLATLREIRRVLRRGGRLCIEVPNAGGWEASWFGSYWLGWDLPRHLYHLTPRTVRDLLVRAGFESISVAQVPSVRTIVASLGLLAGRSGRFWGTVRSLLARMHTPLSLAAGVPASIACVLRKSGLLWAEARRGGTGS